MEIIDSKPQTKARYASLFLANGSALVELKERKDTGKSLQ